MPLHVYITVLDHDWVIMHKQRFPAVLAGMIVLVYLHTSTLPHEISVYRLQKRLICLFCICFVLNKSFICMSLESFVRGILQKATWWSIPIRSAPFEVFKTLEK